MLPQVALLSAFISVPLGLISLGWSECVAQIPRDFVRCRLNVLSAVTILLKIIPDLTIAKFHVNCTEDISLPHHYPWHPRLSQKLGLFRLLYKILAGTSSVFKSDVAGAGDHARRSGLVLGGRPQSSHSHRMI